MKLKWNSKRDGLRHDDKTTRVDAEKYQIVHPDNLSPNFGVTNVRLRSFCNYKREERKIWAAKARWTEKVFQLRIQKKQKFYLMLNNSAAEISLYPTFVSSVFFPIFYVIIFPPTCVPSPCWVDKEIFSSLSSTLSLKLIKNSFFPFLCSFFSVVLDSQSFGRSSLFQPSSRHFSFFFSLYAGSRSAWHGLPSSAR